MALDNKVKELQSVKSEDQYVTNRKLEDEIKQIHDTYDSSVKVYEKLLKLKDQTNKTSDLDKLFSQALVYLSNRNYSSASAILVQLDKGIDKTQADLASAYTPPPNVPKNNPAPESGYKRQIVSSDVGDFLVDIIAADLNSTKVIVDTASDGTCTNDCPVMALGDYAARSGAFAAVNGPYFCPSTYPSCAGKTNSFDTLLMNKNKVYFNSDNNVYSTVPAVIFSGSSARYVSKSLEWGRDTGVDSVIANQPLLVLNGEIVYGNDTEAKRLSKGSRVFIGSTDSRVYIGVIYNANTAEAAHVIQTMGIKNALNLDSGGSTALWSNGRYLAGPGRALPFGILFVKK
jgi:hypothetical protein